MADNSDLYSDTPAGRAKAKSHGQTGYFNSNTSGGWNAIGEAVMGTNTLPMTKAEGDFSLSGETRVQQAALGQALRDQMAGRGPSLARGQLMQGKEAAVRAATAAAASARGANVGLAGRSAAQGASRATMQSARDAAQLRASEQLAAQQQYQALLQAQRQMDVDQAGQQLKADTAWTNYQLQRGEGEAGRRQKGAGALFGLAGGLVSDPTAKTNVQPVGTTAPIMQPAYQPVTMPPQEGFNAQMLSAQLSGQQGLMGQPQTNDPYAIDRAMMKAREDEALAAQQNQPAQQQGEGGGIDLGGALSSMGGILSGIETKQNVVPVGSGVEMKQNIQPFTYRPPAYQQPPSDPRAKTNVAAFPNLASASSAPVSPVVEQAAQVGTYGYEYTPEAAAAYGEQVGQEYFGPMANRTPDSLENNPLYRTSVKRGPDGNAVVDGGRAAVTSIGVTSELAREQMRQADELENMKAAIIAELQGGNENDKRVAGRAAPRKFLKQNPGRTREGNPRLRPDTKGSKPGDPDYDPFNPQKVAAQGERGVQLAQALKSEKSRPKAERPGEAAGRTAFRAAEAQYRAENEAALEAQRYYERAGGNPAVAEELMRADTKGRTGRLVTQSRARFRPEDTEVVAPELYDLDEWEFDKGEQVTTDPLTGKRFAVREPFHAIRGAYLRGGGQAETPRRYDIPRTANEDDYAPLTDEEEKAFNNSIKQGKPGELPMETVGDKLDTMASVLNNKKSTPEQKRRALEAARGYIDTHDAFGDNYKGVYEIMKQRAPNITEEMVRDALQSMAL